MKIEIKHRFTGAVIFEHCVTKNTIKLTVEAAVKASVRLDYARLDYARLDYARLDNASLVNASLDNASLYNASLYNAGLNGASLVNASLVNARLDYARLDYARLDNASLNCASLYNARLNGASLDNVGLNGAIGLPAIACPDSGAFEGWKKCKAGIVVRLRIPETSRRSSATGRKCRAEFVDVLEVIGATEAVSMHDNATKYKVGERVTCDKWEVNRWKGCAGGIHFFITRAEAEDF